MRRKVSHMLLCAVIAFLSGWAGHWLGSRKRSIVHVPETVVRHDTIRSAIPEPEVIVREVPTEVDTAAILADYFSEKHYTYQNCDSSQFGLCRINEYIVWLYSDIIWKLA